MPRIALLPALHRSGGSKPSAGLLGVTTSFERILLSHGKVFRYFNQHSGVDDEALHGIGCACLP
jgi:hypothetical protein